MATAAVTYSFTDATPAEAAEVNTNFNDLVNFVNSDVVHADGTVAMTGALTLPGAPTLGTHATTKTYVDAADVTASGNKARRIAGNTYTAVTAAGLGAIGDYNMSVTWTAEATHYYMIFVGVTLAGTGGDVVATILTDSANTQVAYLSSDIINSTLNTKRVNAATHPFLGLSGSITYKVRGVRQHGSGLFDAKGEVTAPAYITVVDLGF
jgi:hypothetical protein